MPPKLLVPFDGDGNLRRWTHCRPGQNMASRFQSGETTWREAQDFDATMTIEGMKGNLLILSCERFFRYPMSIRDLGIMLQKASVINGMVDGRWGFVRKGSNYGVRYLGEPVRAHASAGATAFEVPALEVA